MPGLEQRGGVVVRRLDTDKPSSDRGPPAKPRLVARSDGPPERRLARLARLVEAEIVPRVVLARRATPRSRRPAAPDGRTPGPADVAKLAELSLAYDVDAASAYVEALRARGMPVETLYLDLLAPTARRLGDLWVADLCRFTDVTVGLCRLQRVLHEISPGFLHETEPREPQRRALLLPLPGEQHTFGLSMVEEFFRRAGWDVWCEPSETDVDPVRVVRRERFAVVGISVSSDTRIDALAVGIRAIRRASLNRSVGVMVGGPIFLARPELAALVGADATAVDGRQAAIQAQNMLDLLPSTF